MAILTVRTFPDPVLRQKTGLVTDFGPELEKLAGDMLETMYAAPGVGLAANQVGVPLRLLVCDADFRLESAGGGDDGPVIVRDKNPRVYVNARLIEGEGNQLFSEGCLSVPGVNEEVKRFERIRIAYQDLKGGHHDTEVLGFLAVILQHEIDHLDGRLFLDRLSSMKKSMLVAKLKKGKIAPRGHSRLKVEL